MVDLRRFCSNPEDGGYIDVSKEHSPKNQVCDVKVRYEVEQNGEIVETEDIKINAVYDHSERKWLMYSRNEEKLVEISGKVIAWYPDREPSISVKEE